MAHNPHEVACPRDRHIHAPEVPQESNAIRTHCRDDDEVFLSSLVGIYCVHFNSTLALVYVHAAKSYSLPVLDQHLLDEPYLALVWRDDTYFSLEVFQTDIRAVGWHHFFGQRGEQ